MNDLPPNATDKADGNVSTPLSVVSLVGDLTRLTQIVQQEGYGSCSECRKAWEALNSGLEGVATSLLAMVVSHAQHSPTTTEKAGTNLHPTFEGIVTTWR